MEFDANHLPKDRTEVWRETIAPNEIKRGEELYNSGATRAAHAIRKAFDGGKCSTCGREWERVDVDNIFAKYFYYRPVCKCYQTCPWCGTVFTEQQDQGVPVHICPNCEMDPRRGPDVVLRDWKERIKNRR